jgi:hypothetical protein
METWNGVQVPGQIQVRVQVATAIRSRALRSPTWSLAVRGGGVEWLRQRNP